MQISDHLSRRYSSTVLSSSKTARKESITHHMEKISSAHTLDQATRANLVKTARLINTNDTCSFWTTLKDLTDKRKCNYTRFWTLTTHTKRLNKSWIQSKLLTTITSVINWEVHLRVLHNFPWTFLYQLKAGVATPHRIRDGKRLASSILRRNNFPDNTLSVFKWL